MKKLILASVVILSFAAGAGRWHMFSDEYEIDAVLDGMGFNMLEKEKIRNAYLDYQEAADRWQEVMDLNGLKPPKRNRAPVIKGDLVDPTIRKIQEQSRKYHNRFEVIKRTQNKWGPSTNLLARAARQSMQSRLNETKAERDAAKAYEKQVKEIQKSAKKDGKSLNKLRKDLEKYRDKAETADFASTCQGLLDLLPVPNGE